MTAGEPASCGGRTRGGKERSVDELIELGRSAGLRHVGTHRLPSADLAIVFRA
ncbi:MAG: hypothetical protein ACRBI6_23190 [Acidimicrobiales bacterium]